MHRNLQSSLFTLQSKCSSCDEYCSALFAGHNARCMLAAAGAGAMSGRCVGAFTYGIAPGQGQAWHCQHLKLHQWLLQLLEVEHALAVEQQGQPHAAAGACCRCFALAPFVVAEQLCLCAFVRASGDLFSKMCLSPWRVCHHRTLLLPKGGGSLSVIQEFGWAVGVDRQQGHSCSWLEFTTCWRRRGRCAKCQYAVWRTRIAHLLFWHASVAAGAAAASTTTKMSI